MNLNLDLKLRVFELYDKIPDNLEWFDFLSFSDSRADWYTKSCYSFTRKVEEETGLKLNIYKFRELFEESKVSDLLSYSKNGFTNVIDSETTKELFTALVAFMIESADDFTKIEKLIEHRQSDS